MNNRDNRSDRGSRSFNSGPREMHKVTCAKCGNETEVPFKPMAQDQFTAGIATSRTNHHEDIKRGEC